MKHVIIDCILIVISGLVAFALVAGVDYFMAHPWQYGVLWTCALPFFLIGMWVTKSYKWHHRSLGELSVRCILALVIGFALLNIAALVLPPSLLASHIGFTQQLATGVCALVCQLVYRALR